jgi:hypothetical protein
MTLVAVLDGQGMYGALLTYGLTWALMGSSILVFLVLWRRGKLDMDESPKYQMMDQDISGEE